MTTENEPPPSYEVLNEDDVAGAERLEEIRERYDQQKAAELRQRDSEMESAINNLSRGGVM